MKKLNLFFTVLIAVVLIFSSGNVFTQQSSISLEEQVDELFRKWDKSDTPGASIAIIKNGIVIFKNGYGMASLEYNVPITPSTIFHVASVSKQFTAFAIDILEDQGKLSLDDDIRKYLPEVPDFRKVITLRHLIHHISGMRDQWELLAMAGWRLDDVITKEHILKMVRHQKELNFEPGAEYLYCNTGFTLLAEIVSRITGKSFREWTAENMFKPLEMTNTHFHDDHQMIVKNRAYSYYSSGDKGYVKSVLNYANVGATSLFTTVEDLSKWMNNFTTAAVGGERVIRQLQMKGVLNNGEEIGYAHGISIGEYKGLKTVGHSGGDAGFRSYLVMFPEQNFGIVILSNLGSFNPSGMAYKVADIYLADYLTADTKKVEKSEKKEITVNTALYQDYAGKYLLDVGMLLNITKEDNKLMIQPEGQQKYELFPESETKFFLKATDAQLTFHIDRDGKTDRITFHQNGRDIAGKRIKREEIENVKLENYEGYYYSDELGTTYQFKVIDGRLVARHRRHDDITLTVKAKDSFSGNRWFFRNVRFTRVDDKITGFKVTGGRVRNLKFKKQQ